MDSGEGGGRRLEERRKGNGEGRRRKVAEGKEKKGEIE